jgi:hypothetical protein
LNPLRQEETEMSETRPSTTDTWKANPSDSHEEKTAKRPASGPGPEDAHEEEGSSESLQNQRSPDAIYNDPETGEPPCRSAPP